MKKTLVSAITAALVVGAASTTFAAANPFSDVPTDSWAYNAVVTLANDGVIDGFPNGTFQGNKNMTRYEMAQIIARAMAKENMSKADKATVQKLAAEFADELNNLGVKVANLEAKSDNVKLTGKVAYTYANTNVKGATSEEQNKRNKNEILFRLNPTADLGNGWMAKARFNAKLNAGQDQSKTNVELDRAYVEGPIGSVDIKAGKIPTILANGLVFDSRLTGGQATYVNKDVAVTGVAGRFNVEKLHKEQDQVKDKTASFYAGQVNYTLNDNVGFNLGYYNYNNLYLDNNQKFDLAALYAGIDAKIDSNVRISGEYAKAQKDMNDDEIYSKLKNAYTIQLDYKEANAKDAGSYGVYAAYRHLGIPALKSSYDGASLGERGFEYGVKYVPAQNVLATAKYFSGKTIEEKDSQKVSKFFGKVEFLF